MTKLPPWDPDEYDREVKAARKRAREQERLLNRAPITERESRGNSRRRPEQPKEKEIN